MGSRLDDFLLVVSRQSLVLKFLHLLHQQLQLQVVVCPPLALLKVRRLLITKVSSIIVVELCLPVVDSRFDVGEGEGASGML